MTFPTNTPSTSDVAAGGSSGRPRPEPHIRSGLPGPESEAWIERDKRSESGGNAYPDLFGAGVYSPVFRNAEGSTLTDVDGNTFVETSGFFSCGTFGYAPTELIETAVEQMRRLPHVPDLPTEPRIQLAEQLCSIAPGDLRRGRVQFDLGGSGSMDLAYKLATYYAKATKSPRSQHRVAAFAGGYHGRTAAGTSLTGSTHAQEGMPEATQPVRFPFPYCYRCPFGKEYPSCDLFCAKYIRQQFESDAYGLYNARTGTCQVSTMVWEPIQAHIGMIFPPDEFFVEMRQLCDDYGITLIDDEVAMGIGHTGNWFAADTYGVVPDVMASSKALTGGIYPLGAVIAKDEIWSPWGEAPDKHMGSYHGNPVGCAVALKNIQLIEERKLLENVRAQGARCNQRLTELMDRHPLIGEGKALGLAIGIELVTDRATKEPAENQTVELVQECMRRGVLVLRLGHYGNRLNLMPPLDSSTEEIDFIFDVIDDALSTVETSIPS